VLSGTAYGMTIGIALRDDVVTFAIPATRQ